jgi:hypothetical protein
LITPLVADQFAEPDSKSGLRNLWPLHPPPRPVEIVQVNDAVPNAPVVSLALAVTE